VWLSRVKTYLVFRDVSDYVWLGEVRFIKRARVMRPATITREGFPHLVHLCHFFDSENTYFATDYETKKIENIESNPRAVAPFDEYREPWSRLKGVMIQGKAEILESGERVQESGPPPQKKIQVL